MIVIVTIQDYVKVQEKGVLVYIHMIVNNGM